MFCCCGRASEVIPAHAPQPAIPERRLGHNPASSTASSFLSGRDNKLIRRCCACPFFSVCSLFSFFFLPSLSAGGLLSRGGLPCRPRKRVEEKPRFRIFDSSSCPHASRASSRHKVGLSHRCAGIPKIKGGVFLVPPIDRDSSVSASCDPATSRDCKLIRRCNASWIAYHLCTTSCPPHSLSSRRLRVGRAGK